MDPPSTETVTGWPPHDSRHRSESRATAWLACCPSHSETTAPTAPELACTPCQRPTRERKIQSVTADFGLNRGRALGARHHSRREIPPHNASPSGRRRSPDTRNTLRIGPAGHRQPGHRPGPDPLGGDRLRHRDAVLGRRHGASPAERQTPGAEPAPGPRCGAHTGTLPHPEPANLRPPDWWTGAAANRPESAICQR